LVGDLLSGESIKGVSLGVGVSSRGSSVITDQSSERHANLGFSSSSSTPVGCLDDELSLTTRFREGLLELVVVVEEALSIDIGAIFDVSDGRLSEGSACRDSFDIGGVLNNGNVVFNLISGWVWRPSSDLERRTSRIIMAEVSVSIFNSTIYYGSNSTNGWLDILENIYSSRKTESKFNRTSASSELDLEVTSRVQRWAVRNRGDRVSLDVTSNKCLCGNGSCSNTGSRSGWGNGSATDRDGTSSDGRKIKTLCANECHKERKCDENR